MLKLAKPTDDAAGKEFLSIRIHGNACAIRLLLHVEHEFAALLLEHAFLVRFTQKVIGVAKLNESGLYFIPSRKKFYNIS